MDIPTLRRGPDKRVPPTDGPSENKNRRDALVASAEHRLTIHPISVGTTSMPLRHEHNTRAPSILLDNGNSPNRRPITPRQIERKTSKDELLRKFVEVR